MKKRQLFAAIAVILSGIVTPLQAGTISDLVKDKLVSYQNGALAPYNASQLGDVKFFAIYFSAHWCGPCRRFTPELVDYYNRTKKANPAFELIFISADHSREEMIEYIKSAKMPWPATEYRKVPQELAKLAGPGIPCLVLIDENGAILSHTYEGQRYLGPGQVLEDLEKRLRKYKNSSGASGSSSGQGKAFDDFFKKTGSQ